MNTDRFVKHTGVITAPFRFAIVTASIEGASAFYKQGPRAFHHDGIPVLAGTAVEAQALIEIVRARLLDVYQVGYVRLDKQINRGRGASLTPGNRTAYNPSDVEAYQRGVRKVGGQQSVSEPFRGIIYVAEIANDVPSVQPLSAHKTVDGFALINRGFGLVDCLSRRLEPMVLVDDATIAFGFTAEEAMVKLAGQIQLRAEHVRLLFHELISSANDCEKIWRVSKSQEGKEPWGTDKVITIGQDGKVLEEVANVLPF